MKKNARGSLKQYSFRDTLKKRAEELRKRCEFDRPPYDPWKIAESLRVQVEGKDTSGVDGYVEVREGKYFAVISENAHPTRQRFTLAHELCHVLLMQLAEDGKSIPLRRYRTNGKLPGLHQDPAEEALCNYFAGELLMPVREVKSRLSKCSVEPQTIVRFANEFDVSTQAAAVNIFKARRSVVACSLWNLESLWPIPVWWVGQRTDCKSEMRGLEGLVKLKEDLTEMWETYSDRRQPVRIRISPTLRMRFAIVLITDLAND